MSVPGRTPPGSIPLAPLFAVAGLAMPAWIHPEGRGWTATIAGSLGPGPPAFFGPHRDIPQASLARSPSMAFPAFGQPGAALEFLRLLGTLARRTVDKPDFPRPIGLWRFPDPTFSARPACPRHGRVDPSDMARLAVRLAFAWESAPAGGPMANLRALVASAVISEDPAGPGFYDPAFPHCLDWMAHASRDPTAAILSLRPDPHPDGSRAVDPSLDFLAGTTFAPTVAPPRPRRGAAASRDPIPAVPRPDPAPTPPPIPTPPRLADPDFDPGIVAGIELGGLSLHAHEVGSTDAGARPAAVGDGGCAVRTYRTLVTLDPASLGPGGLYGFLVRGG